MSIEEQRQLLIQKIRNIEDFDFETVAIEVFQYQAAHNLILSKYLKLINIIPEAVTTLEELVFLPIQLFKKHKIQSGNWNPEISFSSSGTTSSQTSIHVLRDSSFYTHNAQKGFEFFYGPLENYCIIALLPSYLERTGSSLVFMVDDFINKSKYTESGFYLKETEALIQKLGFLKEQKIPTVLIGVSFALLDLAERYSIGLNSFIIMETGGMKGRRKEITREELHSVLTNAFQVHTIHSEYGMTELFSQAYSQGAGRFQSAPTLRVVTKEITDPFCTQKFGKTGILNLIDLANIDTCSFIATEDLGRIYKDGSFEILGRLDASDIRGCNLMVDSI